MQGNAPDLLVPAALPAAMEVDGEDEEDADARDEVEEYLMSDEDEDMGAGQAVVHIKEGKAHVRGKVHGRDRKKNEKQSGPRAKGSNRKMAVAPPGKVRKSQGKAKSRKK